MEPMYIRFGAPPAGGRSWNADAQEYEPGVSVYQAEWQSSDRDVVCVRIPRGAATGTLDLIADRPVYIVTGTLLSQRGGDGEPLMAPGCRAEYVGVIEIVNYVFEEEEE